MAEDNKSGGAKGPTREAELAAALRANLRRRKAGAAKPPVSKPTKKDGQEP